MTDVRLTRTPHPATLPGQRWRAFAAGLLGRGCREAWKPGGPGMSLFVPPRASPTVHVHRQTAHWSISPVIALSIAPLLRATLTQHWFAALAPAPSVRPALSHAAAVVVRERILAAGPEAPSSSPSHRERAFSPERTPLVRAWVRAEAAPLQAALRAGKIVLQNAQALAQRATSERRRVEARPAAELPALSRALPRPSPEPTSTRADRESLVTTRDPASPSATRGRPAGPPPIDVDRLTDQVIRQIDSRLLAHRERLGRVF